MPPDRHPPLARPVADHVVEEAPVLDGGRRRGPRRTSRSGRRSAPPRARCRPGTTTRSPRRAGGRRTASHTAVADAAGAPRRRAPAVRAASGRRPGPAARRRRRTRCQAAYSSSDPVSARNDSAVAGPGSRSTSRPEVAPVSPHRGERGHGPRRERHVEPEVGDDAVGQQADQVRVAGQAGVDAGEHPAAHRGAAHVAGPLEHAHRQPGPPQVGGGDEGVVAAADDHDVVAVAAERCGRHDASLARAGGRPGGRCRPCPSRHAAMPTIELSTPRPGVTVLTLNRPERLNAMNHELVHDLHARPRRPAGRPHRPGSWC